LQNPGIKTELEYGMEINHIMGFDMFLMVGSKLNNRHNYNYLYFYWIKEKNP